MSNTIKTDIEAMGDLFDLQVRGSLAVGFIRVGKFPTARQWALLDGDLDLTLRDVGEMVHDLGLKVEIYFEERESGQ